MARYFPEVFTVSGLQQAREIILTAEGPGADTETRWALETPYVRDLILRQLAPQPGTLLLDYGCGVGRLAKALVQATGCSVIGVDISPSMRALAVEYVGSARFLAVSPEQLDTLVGAGLRADGAIAAWVLQHCPTPAEDIARIRRSLAPGGGCFVLNMLQRAIPALRDGAEGGGFTWASDGVDVAALLRAAFQVQAEGVPGGPGVPNMADAGAYWMALRAAQAIPPQC